MRNRYYDPATGKFTQEDLIGLAGGLNLYGFAGGDPINFSDPFGLCRDDDDVCKGLVTVLRGIGGDNFNRAADIYEQTNKRVHYVSGDSDKLTREQRAANRDDDPLTFGFGNTNDAIYLNVELEAGDFLITAAHEAYFHVEPYKGLVLNVHWDNQRFDYDSFTQLPARLQGQAPGWRYQLTEFLRYSTPD
jgi:uncharacterized protein RhaS with RHS repeats